MDPALAALRRWGAVPTGEAWRTPSSHLAAGTRDGEAVIAKVALVEEERVGGRLMAWWDGRGAVPVLERDDDAVLLLRATGPRDLAATARRGGDDEATAVLVDAALALHAHGRPSPEQVPLVPLRRWFAELVDRPQGDPLLAAAAQVARGALAATGEADAVVLHGDVHHGNVLDLGDRWAAIDPKGLLGHRAFDLANLFCNPDGATALGRLEPRLALVADRAALERPLLERWVVAWCGLSLAWDPQDPATWHGSAARGVLARLLPS